MSSDVYNTDGFTLVSSKRCYKSKNTKIPNKHNKATEPDPDINIKKLLQKINTAVVDLKGSNYFKDFYKSVSTALSTRVGLELVCFGIGHIADCNISRYQLALLLCMKDTFTPKSVLIHDPILYKAECYVLQQLGLSIIAENTEGGYITPSDSVTVLYLPHCPKQLTNNFLWSNWGQQLQNSILICNSFKTLFENQPSRILTESVPFICKIEPYTVEIAINNNFKFTDIFNDTAIHTFPAENLESLDSEFWLKGEKPNYKNTEEFITSLMIEKLEI